VIGAPALPDQVIVAGVGSRDSNPVKAIADTMRMAGKRRSWRGRCSARLPADLVARTLALRPVDRRASRAVAGVGLPLILFISMRRPGNSYHLGILDELLSRPEVVELRWPRSTA